MANEWQERSISELCSLIVDCVNKTAPKVEYKTPYKMLRTTNIRHGLVNLQDCQYVEKDVFEKWTRRASVLKGDIILTREAPLGEVGRVGADDSVFLGQRLMQYRANEKILDSRFLLYSFLSPYLQQQFKIHEGTGSVVSHIRVPDCLKFKLKLPPLPEQKAIAHILCSLDDKIELNRQMNATLEAMAQALFKSWFVDFDPVIDNALAAGNPIPDELEAKAAARQALGDVRKPLPEDIRSLFPNAFVFTEEMGWIPEGWEISSLKDVSLVKGGYAFKSKDFTFSGSPVIKIKNINSDRTVDINDVQYIPDSIANKAKSFWLHTGDLLMAMTGATVGKFGLLTTIKDEHYLLNQRVAKFFPLTNLSKKIWFVYCCLNQEITTDYITNIAHGSAQPNISGDAIMTAKIIFPTSNLIRLFDENVDSIFSKMLKNNQQAYSLIQLRDTLLPKLLSGELRIPEAERLVVEAIA